MKNTLHVVMLCTGLALMGCAGGTRATPKQYSNFGESPSPADLPVVSVQSLMTQPEAYDGKQVRVTGTVSEVCSAKGCWLSLGGPQDEGLFVKFTCPIDGRLIPMEAVGKPAIVEGTVSVVSMTQAEARHYAKDGGAKPEEIEKILGPQKRITVASPSAKIAELR